MEQRRITASLGERNFLTTVSTGRHTLTFDEPAALGGSDAGPTPVETLLASLAACTAITVRMYAQRKGFPLRRVDVGVTAEIAPPALVRSARVTLGFDGDLTDEQRRRLVEIAHHCPVHKALAAGVHIEVTPS